MLPLKKILCPTDFSEASYEGLKAADELALHFSAELCLIHVVAPIPTTVMPAAPIPVSPATFDVTAYQHELEASARQSLQDVAEQRISKEISVKLVVMHGSAAGEIIRVANDEGTDLIVIATHGQTGWRRMVFGSVAEKVVRLAGLPVLAVPAPEEENE
jgi:nucleotide-binding universal stress UspA family protein